MPNSLTDLAEALANPIKYQSELERRAKQLAILYDEQEAEAENAGDADDAQSLAGGGSTPECASPSSVKSTIEYLKRTGSAAKPGVSFLYSFPSLFFVTLFCDDDLIGCVSGFKRWVAHNWTPKNRQQ